MSKTLLLVDDEPHLLFSLSEYFRRQGYQVLAAESGGQALDLLVQSEPDVIVSDIMMDEMDGFELQKRVNALTSETIPFMFLTAKSDLGDRLTGLHGGADDYITKPFDPEELEARVATVLNRVRITREKEHQFSEEIYDRLLAQLASRLERPVEGLLDDLQLALDERFGKDADSKRYYLDRALENASLLEELVQDISWATSEVQQHESLDIQHRRIAPIVRSAAATAARIAEEKSIDLKITCGGLLADDVDPRAIERALSRLLEAAVRVSPRGSTVTIKARRAQDGGLSFIIVDGGCATDERDSRLGRVANAIELARGIAKGHAGQLSLRKDADGRQSYHIWLPSRRSKARK